MANALYPKFKEALLGQNPSIDLDGDTIKVALVNTTTDYTYDSAHQFLSSVTQYSGTTAQTLTTKTVTDGVFDADDVTFSTVAADGSKNADALIIFKDTGSAATSPLIAYFDSHTAVLPNGGDINVVWSSAASKIFAL